MSADTPTAGQGGLTEDELDALQGVFGEALFSDDPLPRAVERILADRAAALTARLSEPDVVEAAAFDMCAWSHNRSELACVRCKIRARVALAAAAGVIR